MRINPESWYALISGQRRGPLATATRCGLWLASWPYSFVTRTRNVLFDLGWKRTHRAAVPVVSVGNLTLGGTGKTPCVEWVARFFREREVQVAILSRGYGSGRGVVGGNPWGVLPSQVEQGRNDEALVLEENLPDVPHLQGADRLALAATAVEELESELLVLDDGFQHRRLGRDLDVVLIDATRPPARDYVFPRGTLREPPGGLKRTGAVLLTRCDQVSADEVEALRAWVLRRVPHVPVGLTEHRPTELVGCDGATEPLESLRGKTVGAFCGIGNPQAFRHTLEALGAVVADLRVFPDHHPYTREDVDALGRWAEALPADAVLATTQKDFVKLRVPGLDGRSLWAVRIGLHFREGEEAFATRLERVIRPASE